jgi:thioredoxin-like negative regulator of GroEL
VWFVDPGATFIKVDTDKNKSVASRFSISAMPTFIFLRGGKQVEMVCPGLSSSLAIGQGEYC